VVVRVDSKMRSYKRGNQPATLLWPQFVCPCLAIVAFSFFRSGHPCPAIVFFSRHNCLAIVCNCESFITTPYLFSEQRNLENATHHSLDGRQICTPIQGLIYSFLG